ncbi:MAG: pyruvate formate lyase family protein [Armatimonadota bacterium]
MAVRLSGVDRHLSDTTHMLAHRAQSGEWGRALVDMKLDLSFIDGFENLSEEMLYARGVEMVCNKAPLRVLPGQLIVGSATLAQATRHTVPVYLSGKLPWSSTSHITLGFDRVLHTGYRALREQIRERLSRPDVTSETVDYLNSLMLCLDAANIWHQRYLDLLDDLIASSDGEEKAGYRQVRNALANVPENPPSSFHEAVQSLWFMWAFQRLCGNWPGIGRIDEMLGSYLRHDLESGLITLDEAREILAHFWINGCEWIGAPDPFNGTGDGQFYQNIILGGVDVDGHEVTNEVTYLVLDIIEELHISDFPIAVRINKNTPEQLLRRIAEVQRYGGGVVSIYCEDTVIAGLVGLGFPVETARRFTNDGCWEAQIPGETCFIYTCIDIVMLLQQTLGVTGDDQPADFSDFESLYAAFRERLNSAVSSFHTYADDFPRNYIAERGKPLPSGLIDLLTNDCIEKGLGYHNKGARYHFCAPHASGPQDAANILLAIKKMVYEEQLISLPDLVDCLKHNWAGHEPLRHHIISSVECYGNDSPCADAMTRRVLDDFVAAVERIPERNGVMRPAGVSTFGREIGWRVDRGATALGTLADDYLACNFSPTPGTDRNGPTAVIKSYCSMNLVRLPSGAALELKLDPRTVEGEAGLDALVGLLRGFERLGGFYTQVDVVSNDTLLDAQQHPEKYLNLAVRVSGWSARFVTLNQDWQNMIINRTQQV